MVQLSLESCTFNFYPMSDYSFTRVLSFDPGEVTGVATLDLLSRKVVLYEVPLKAVQNIYTEFLPHLILMERFPSDQTDLAYDVIGETARYRRELGKYVEIIFVEVSPSEWKPFARASKWACPTSLGTHARDAYNMMRYALYIRYKISLEYPNANLTFEDSNIRLWTDGSICF